MRILLVNQFFWPDLAATSQLLTDLARHLNELGHTVIVICGRSSYAGADTTEPPLVRTIRVDNLAFGRGKVARVLSYASFFAAALWHGMRITKPDVIVTLTTPPLLCVLGLTLQKCRGCRHFIWEMDLYPDVAVDVRVLAPESWITRTIRAIADYCRREAAGVIVLGECMRQRLIGRGISQERIHVCENWADGTLIYPVQRPQSQRLTVVYPGNLGLAHDVDTLAEAMKRLNSDERIALLFVGGGPRLRDLEQFCEAHGIRNASFLPYRNRRQLNDLLNAADVGLVTQSAACVGSLVPSKVYTLLAAGLPILFIGPRAATPSMLLNCFQCGWQVDCGDSHALVSLLRSLAADPESVRKLGLLAREVFLAHYDRPIGVRRICDSLGVPEGIS